MKKNKFLALTMLCSTLCGIPAKAQEIKDSGSQGGAVENSSNNEGNKNLEENEDLEKNKNLEEKSRTRNKKDKISRFVDLVIDHPIASFMIGGGSVLMEEGIRRKFFSGTWGVDKFGYNEEEDCIYRNPKGKINVVILGPKKYREKFIGRLKNDEKFRHDMQECIELLCASFRSFGYRTSDVWESIDYEKDGREWHAIVPRAEFKNWNIIEEDFDFAKKPSSKFMRELHGKLKDNVDALFVVHGGEWNDDFAKICPRVKSIKCGKETDCFPIGCKACMTIGIKFNIYQNQAT